MNQVLKGTPVTPHDMHQRLIRTPIRNPPPMHQPQVSTAAITTLVAQFRAQLESWQKPLYGPITKYQNTNTLYDRCHQNQTITLVSDASVQKSKQSGFAWILTQGETKLWAGVGLALGDADDMYSGRAEAFRLLAGLIFVSYYISCFPYILECHAKLQCFCDNMGIITNVMEMRNKTVT